MPGLRPVFVFVVTVTILASANVFGQAYLTTQGAPAEKTRTAIMFIAEEGFLDFHLGSAAAMSYVLAVFLMALSAGVFFFFRDKEAKALMGAATARHPRQPRRRPAAACLLRYVALIVLTLLFLSPIIWMVLTAFKTEEESAAIPPTCLPTEWTTEAFDTIFSSSAQTPVFRWFLNSVIAALGMGVVVLATAAPAAYALARMEFRGKRLIFAAIIATLFVPPIIFLAPNYEIVAALGWLDTLPP